MLKLGEVDSHSCRRAYFSATKILHMKQTLLNAFFTLTILAVGFAPVVAQPGPGGAAPVVITEIMYNPPEGGNDTLEFIEIYNPNVSANVNMSGYYFSFGVEYTFPSGFILGPQQFALVSGDSVIFEQWYGLPSFQWTGGTALNNDGEGLALRNSIGGMVDTVFFDDNTSWPASADAGGTSLVLCDITSDNNLPASWAAATASTGLTVNAISILADPGALSNCGTVGIADDNVITTVVYPNPTEGAFRITFSPLERTGAIHVHNALGQMVYTQRVPTGATSANVDVALNAGMYIVSLENGASTERHYLSVTK